MARKFYKRFIVLTRRISYCLIHMYKNAAKIYGTLQAVSVRLIQNIMVGENNLKLWHYFIYNHYVLCLSWILSLFVLHTIQPIIHLTGHVCLSWAMVLWYVDYLWIHTYKCNFVLYIRVVKSIKYSEFILEMLGDFWKYVYVAHLRMPNSKWKKEESINGPCCYKVIINES